MWNSKQAIAKRQKFDECASARATAIASAQPTKAELREQLTEAVRNTATIQTKGVGE